MSDLKVNIIKHPLIQHKLTLMRKKETGAKDFRQLLDEISMLMAYEVTRDFPTKDIEIETPVAKCVAKTLAGKKVAVVPILRAGLGMVNGIINLIPAAKIGHIGLYRDEKTLEPVEYFCKMPKDIDERLLLVVDPMLACYWWFSNRSCRNAKKTWSKIHDFHVFIICSRRYKGI